MVTDILHAAAQVCGWLGTGKDVPPVHAAAVRVKRALGKGRSIADMQAPGSSFCKLTAVGFEPTPLRTGA